MNPQAGATRVVQSAAELSVDQATLRALRGLLPNLAEDVVSAIIREVPSYTGALSGRMGDNIRTAVQTALEVFLDLVGGEQTAGTSLGAGADAVYELGRGEARNGRTMDALLAAYRVGARVSWQGLSTAAVQAGLPAEFLAKFAELVFAYIDELSANSAAGHADELATRGRARERYLAQLGKALLDGQPRAELHAAAERADWPQPRTLTAVLLPTARAHAAMQLLSPHTILLTEDLTGMQEPDAVMLVPDVDGNERDYLTRILDGASAVIGPARPWHDVGVSFRRALRTATIAPRSTTPVDTEERLVDLVLTADPEALDDLRARALAPLVTARPAVAARLRETLRAWLLHQGRRDDVAAHLIVHPQTVRYRMTQLRDLFGDALNDPQQVLELTLALAIPAEGTNG